MELQIRKYNLIQWLINSEDENLIALLESLQKSEEPDNADWWRELSESQRKGIDRGLQSIKVGDSYSHKEVREGIRDKYGI